MHWCIEKTSRTMAVSLLRPGGTRRRTHCRRCQTRLPIDLYHRAQHLKDRQPFGIGRRDVYFEPITRCGPERGQPFVLSRKKFKKSTVAPSAIHPTMTSEGNVEELLDEVEKEILSR